MKDFTLALVQQRSLLGEKRQNRDSTEKWVELARRRGADLICFPELSLSGHGGHRLMIRDAEAVPDGPSCRWLMDLARRSDCYICAGMAEEDRRATYNTQVLVGPGGFVGKQRKVHPSRDEYLYFRHGSRFDVFDLPFAKIGIAICFDNEIVESARTLAVQGAEVLLCPHAARFGTWPSTAGVRRKVVAKLKDHWRLVHACRALDNAAYVGLCNAAGQSAPQLNGCDANHAGGSMVFAPDGSVLAQSRARDIAEEMLLTRLAASRLEARREGECFALRVRRVEAFAPLTEPTE